VSLNDQTDQTTADARVTALATALSCTDDTASVRAAILAHATLTKSVATQALALRVLDGLGMLDQGADILDRHGSALIAVLG
jgi:hypothetical protein